jgi:hypothetical protein
MLAPGLPATSSAGLPEADLPAATAITAPAEEPSPTLHQPGPVLPRPTPFSIGAPVSMIVRVVHGLHA